MDKTPVKGYEDIYWITIDGRVFSKRRELSPQLNPQTGYMTVYLTKDHKSRTMTVHRLVALTFIPIRKSKPQVNHKNSIKTDNRVENLEWCTHGENMQHSWNHRRKVLDEIIKAYLLKGKVT
jgi:hypothetical protein